MTLPREMGQLPLSIGTSLALEGLLGVHPGNPHLPAGHKAINALWINLRTLVRNYFQAMKAEDAERVNFPTAAITLLSEVQAIPDILRTHRRPMSLMFYHQDIKDIKKQFPNAEYKRANTEKQKFYQLYEDITLIHLVEECTNASVPVLTKFLPSLPINGRQIAAMLTHYPKDLFWKSSFERLFLLESHTGRLKTYVDWYTKLQGVKADNAIPLNEFTLQVFGDGYLFNGQAKKIRDEVKQLAQVKRWNGSTSSSKVRADIMGSGSGVLKETYRLLMP